MKNNYGAVIFALVIFGWSVLSDLLHLKSPPEERQIRCPSSNPEGLLACGDKVELSSLSFFDAALFSSIPEKSFNEMIRNRNAILAHSRSLPKNQEYRALQMISGIGETRAKLLAEVIKFK